MLPNDDNINITTKTILVNIYSTFTQIQMHAAYIGM